MTEIILLALFNLIALASILIGVKTMATLTDLTTAVDRNTTATNAAVAAFNAAVPDLQPAITQIDANSAALEQLVTPVTP